MAWVSPRVYAILSSSEEGKDIIERLPDMTQDECSQALDEFFGKGGKGFKSNVEYSKAKMDDEAEERAYQEIGDEEVSEKDYEEEEEDGSKYLEKTWDDYFSKQKGWERQEDGRYDFGDDINYGSVNDDGAEKGKLTATRVRNGQHDKPERQFFDDPQEAREWVEENNQGENHIDGEEDNDLKNNKSIIRKWGYDPEQEWNDEQIDDIVSQLEKEQDVSNTYKGQNGKLYNRDSGVEVKENQNKEIIDAFKSMKNNIHNDKKIYEVPEDEQGAKKEKYQSILKKAFNALDKQDAMDIIFSNTEVHKAFQKVQRKNPNDSFWYQLSLLPDELYGDE